MNSDALANDMQQLLLHEQQAREAEQKALEREEQEQQRQWQDYCQIMQQAHKAQTVKQAA